MQGDSAVLPDGNQSGVMETACLLRLHTLPLFLPEHTWTNRRRRGTGGGARERRGVGVHLAGHCMRVARSRIDATPPTSVGYEERALHARSWQARRRGAHLRVKQREDKACENYSQSARDERRRDHQGGGSNSLNSLRSRQGQ